MSQVGDTRSTTTGSSARVGYTRVSTVSQTLDQQNAALEAADVAKTFSDTMSGARDDCPGLAAFLEYVRRGGPTNPNCHQLGANSAQGGQGIYRLPSLNTARTTDDTVVLDYKDSIQPYLCASFSRPVRTSRIWSPVIG
jgi:hypothetical protein